MNDWNGLDPDELLSLMEEIQDENEHLKKENYTQQQQISELSSEVSMLKTAMKGMLGANFAPIALLSTQTASGTNYCFFCEAQSVSADPSSEYAFVYVYEDETGSASVTEILNFVGE